MQNNFKEFLLKNGICRDNEYFHKYVSMICENRDNKKQIGYDKHHIVPRRYYRNKKLAIDNSNENVVFLSRSNHILSHIYLCFCSANSLYTYANYTAVLLLTNNTKSKSNVFSEADLIETETHLIKYRDEIDEAAKVFSQIQSERVRANPPKISEDGMRRRLEGIKNRKPPTLNKRMVTYNNKRIFIDFHEVDKYIEEGATVGWGEGHSEKSKEKNRMAHIGKKLPHTEEWNNNIRKSLKGKPKSDELKAKISKTLKGNCEKCGKNRGKIVINNGTTLKYVFEKDFLENYEPCGWHRGRGNIDNRINTIKGKIRINNEHTAMYVTIEEFERKYSKEGWHRGYEWKK